LLAGCVAVSVNVGAVGAESPASSGIGMKLGQHGVSLAGYRRYHDYANDDEFDDPSPGYYRSAGLQVCPTARTISIPGHVMPTFRQ
jgi:hypothetical protein